MHKVFKNKTQGCCTPLKVHLLAYTITNGQWFIWSHIGLMLMLPDAELSLRFFFLEKQQQQQKQKQNMRPTWV